MTLKLNDQGHPKSKVIADYENPISIYHWPVTENTSYENFVFPSSGLAGHLDCSRL